MSIKKPNGLFYTSLKLSSTEYNLFCNPWRFTTKKYNRLINNGIHVYCSSIGNNILCIFNTKTTLW